MVNLCKDVLLRIARLFLMMSLLIFFFQFVTRTVSIAIAASQITRANNALEPNLQDFSSLPFTAKPLLPNDMMVVNPTSFSGTAPCPHDQYDWVCTVTLSLWNPGTIDRNWMASGGNGNAAFNPPNGTLNDTNPTQQVTIDIAVTICSTSYTLYFTGNVNPVTVTWSCEKSVPTPTPVPTAKFIPTPIVLHTPTPIKSVSPTPRAIPTPNPKHSSSPIASDRTPFQENKITSTATASADPASSPQKFLPFSILGIYVVLFIILAVLIVLCTLVIRNHRSK